MILSLCMYAFNMLPMGVYIPQFSNTKTRMILFFLLTRNLYGSIPSALLLLNLALDVRSRTLFKDADIYLCTGNVNRRYVLKNSFFGGM